MDVILLTNFISNTNPFPDQKTKSNHKANLKTNAIPKIPVLIITQKEEINISLTDGNKYLPIVSCNRTSDQPPITDASDHRSWEQIAWPPVSC